MAFDAPSVNHLNGEPVGAVTGWDTSWGVGRSQPEAGFSPFATTFGPWSVLKHADGDRLTRDAVNELAQVEHQLDRIHFPADGVWVDTFEVNIDGDLVEWKAY